MEKYYSSTFYSIFEDLYFRKIHRRKLNFYYKDSLFYKKKSKYIRDSLSVVEGETSYKQHGCCFKMYEIHMYLSRTRSFAHNFKKEKKKKKMTTNFTFMKKLLFLVYVLYGFFQIFYHGISSSDFIIFFLNNGLILEVKQN